MKKNVSGLERAYSLVLQSDEEVFWAELNNYLNLIESDPTIFKALNGEAANHFQQLKLALANPLISRNIPEVSRSELVKFQNALVDSLENKKSASFDPDKSILYVNQHEIPIARHKNQYYLLEKIFEKPIRDWQYSEIAESIDPITPGKGDNFYDVMTELKKKTAAVGVEDLFLANTRSVILNKDYLPE